MYTKVVYNMEDMDSRRMDVRQLQLEEMDARRMEVSIEVNAGRRVDRSVKTGKDLIWSSSTPRSSPRAQPQRAHEVPLGAPTA